MFNYGEKTAVFLSKITAAQRNTIINAVSEYYAISKESALNSITEEAASPLLEFVTPSDGVQSMAKRLMKKHGY